MSDACESRPRRSFRPGERLRRKGDFTAVFSRGARLSASGVILLYLRNDLGFSRLGLAVSRKVGKAVRRNRLRRLIREGFRLTKHRLPRAVDVVAIPGKRDPLTLDLARKAFLRLADVLSRDAR